MIKCKYKISRGSHEEKAFVLFMSDVRWGLIAVYNYCQCKNWIDHAKPATGTFHPRYEKKQPHSYKTDSKLYSLYPFMTFR